MASRALLFLLGGLIAATFVVALMASSERGVQWIHLVGLGLSAILLLIIGFGRMPGTPRRPPD